MKPWIQSPQLCMRPSTRLATWTGKCCAPHPVREATSLGFALARPVQAELMLTDVTGRRVATVACGHFGAGLHEITWRPGDVPAGIYQTLLRLDGRQVDSRRILVLSGE